MGKIDNMYDRFDRILACDRQTDRQTSCDSIASRGKSISLDSDTIWRRLETSELLHNY